MLFCSEAIKPSPLTPSNMAYGLVCGCMSLCSLQTLVWPQMRTTFTLDQHFCFWSRNEMKLHLRKEHFYITVDLYWHALKCIVPAEMFRSSAHVSVILLLIGGSCGSCGFCFVTSYGENSEHSCKETCDPEHQLPHGELELNQWLFVAGLVGCYLCVCALSVVFNAFLL